MTEAEILQLIQLAIQVFTQIWGVTHPNTPVDPKALALHLRSSMPELPARYQAVVNSAMAVSSAIFK